MATETKVRTWYEAKTGNHQGLVIEEGTGRNVAVAYDKADARLIAAAPALLAALKTVQAFMGDGMYGDPAMMDTVDAAVEHAEGRT